jgi:hypothetical protein
VGRIDSATRGERSVIRERLPALKVRLEALLAEPDDPES